MTLFVAFGALLLLLVYIYLLSRHFMLGWASLLVVELIHETFGVTSQLIGKVHLDPVDVVSICLLAAGALRTATRVKRINAPRLLAICYIVLFAFSFVRGFYSNGMATASNETRGYLGPLLGMLYFLTAPTDEKSLRRYTTMYLWFGALLCLVAALGAAGLPVGLAAPGNSNGSVSDARYLPASGASAVAICSFLALATVQYRKRSFLNRGLPIFYLAAAIYLRHRSVWMMVLSGTIALAFIDWKLFRRLLPFAMVAVGVIAGLAIYIGGLEGVASADQFQDSATNEQTWQWRVNSWTGLMFDQDQTALTVIVGKSMGSGYWRFDSGSNRSVTVHPHNEYVNEYLRVGAVGALIVILFALRPIVRLWRLTRLDPVAVYPSTSAWAAVVLSVVVFGAAYDFEAHSFALIAIANAILIQIEMPEGDHLLEEEDEWNALPQAISAD